MRVKKPVRACKTTLAKVFDNDRPNGLNYLYVAPVKATVLSQGSGVLIEDEVGDLFLVNSGIWFQYGDTNFHQVSMFNELQDKGFTQLKDRAIRYPEAKEVIDGESLEVQDIERTEEVNEVLPSKAKSKRKD